MIDETENESFEAFKDKVPKNEFEWEGSVVLYEAGHNLFYNIAFGSGGNLDDSDIDEGYDDYIMVESYTPSEKCPPFAELIWKIQERGYIDSDTEGLDERHSGQLLLKRSEWTDGDIRRFLLKAIDFVEYIDFIEYPDNIKNMIYITSDN